MPKFPARVHIILARESNAAIVIRRGPSKSVATLGWDRDHDTFQLGQWLRGRIYERECDLSPDGRHFLYLAFKGKRRPEQPDTWTAISRAPYLKALGFWGSDSFNGGGGLFLSNRQFWHSQNAYEASSPMDREADGLERISSYPHEQNSGNLRTYYRRLQRDGWKWTGRGEKADVFEKPLPSGWVLEKTVPTSRNGPVGQRWEYDTHRLLQPKTGQIVEHPDWEWADLIASGWYGRKAAGSSPPASH